MEHTEKVIEEMLENLLESDEEEEKAANKNFKIVKAAAPLTTHTSSHSDLNKAYKCTNELTPTSAHNLTIAEELRKLRDEYPMSADSDETLTTPSALDLKTAAKDDIVGKVEGGDGDGDGDVSIGECGDAGDISPKTSSSKISYDAEQIAYRNEVSRVLFAGNIENCPAENTPEYFAAAQEYAIYGNDFMDFLPDFEQLYLQVKQSEIVGGKTLQNVATNADARNVAATCFEAEKSNSEFRQKSRFDFANRESNVAINSNEKALIEQTEPQQPNYVNKSNFHGYQTRPNMIATSTVIAQQTAQQTALSAMATAGAATAATYYQLCSNLQRPASTTVINATPTFPNAAAAAATAAVNANVLLGSNVSANLSANAAAAAGAYQASPYMYHQQQISTASNIGQAAAAAKTVAGNMRFKPNTPLLPLTTASPSTAPPTSNVNVYERVVYAHLLQQQFIKQRQQHLQQQQQQQAIAAATLFQQQLQRQQQLKIAAAIQQQQQQQHAANNTAASTSNNIDLTANLNMQQRSSTTPTTQLLNFSASLTSSSTQALIGSNVAMNKPTQMTSNFLFNNSADASNNGNN